MGTSDLILSLQGRYFQSPHLLTYVIQHCAPTRRKADLHLTRLSAALWNFDPPRLVSGFIAWPLPLSTKPKDAKPRPGPFHPSGLRTPWRGRGREKKKGKSKNRNKLPFSKITGRPYTHLPLALAHTSPYASLFCFYLPLHTLTLTDTTTTTPPPLVRLRIDGSELESERERASLPLQVACLFLTVSSVSSVEKFP